MARDDIDADYRDAWDEGRAAFRAGEPATANPYRPSGHERDTTRDDECNYAWGVGWDDEEEVRDNFIALGMKREGVTRERLLEKRAILPCTCDESVCVGWASISNDPEAIANHRSHEEPLAMGRDD